MMEGENFVAPEKMNKRPRQGKTTRQQYAMYVEELKSNESFRTHKFNVAHQDVLEESWACLTKKLNCCGGPQRSTVQWKKIFTDWKSSTRKKARIIDKLTKKTGGGPPERPLNDLEEALVNLTGKVVVKGFENVEEMGVSNNDQDDIALSGTELDGSRCNNNLEMKITQMNDNNEVDTLPIQQHDNTGQSTPKPTLKRKNILSSQRTYTDGLSFVKKRKEGVLLGSVKQLVEKQRDEESVLKEISENLKELVDLKRHELLLLQTKLQLKYNVTVESSVESQENSD